MLDQFFADLATGFSGMVGVPYYDATATWPGTPTYDDGGSITAAGTPIVKACSVQFDYATQAMRQAEGFLETDMRLLVLAASLSASLNTKAQIAVAAGPFAGTWELLSVTSDPAGIGWECRGRRVA